MMIKEEEYVRILRKFDFMRSMPYEKIYGVFIKDKTEDLIELSHKSNANGASMSSNMFTSLLESNGYKGLYLAHNHPGSPCYPSDKDVTFTKAVMDICKKKRVKFYEHIILNDKDSYQFFRKQYGFKELEP